MTGQKLAPAQLNNVLNDLEPQSKIFRIIKLSHLEQILKENISFFSKPATWTDKYDSLFLQSKAILKNEDGSEQTAKHSHLDDFYCQCWCKQNGESDAMWRIYSPNHDNVMIVSTVGQIFDSIWNKGSQTKYIDYFCGAVAYVEQQKLSDPSYFIKNISNPMFPDSTCKNLAHSLLIKLSAYQHEDEVRFIIRQKNAPVVGGKGILHNHQTQLGKCLTHIIIDPRDNSETIEKICQLTERYNISPSVMPSNLYTEPDLAYYID